MLDAEILQGAEQIMLVLFNARVADVTTCCLLFCCVRVADLRTM